MKPQAVPLDRFAIKAASDYYFYEGEDLICQQDVGALVQDESQYEPKFLLLDHLGSTRAELVFDPSTLAPQIQEYYDLMPYGEVIDPPTVQESVLFTGKQRDFESELSYFSARFFGSEFLRFNSADSFSNDWEIATTVRLKFASADGRYYRCACCIENPVSTI